MKNIITTAAVIGLLLGLSQTASAELLDGKKVGKRFFPLVSDLIEKPVRFDLGSEKIVSPVTPFDMKNADQGNSRLHVDTNNDLGHTSAANHS